MAIARKKFHKERRKLKIFKTDGLITLSEFNCESRIIPFRYGRVTYDLCYVIPIHNDETQLS